MTKNPRPSRSPAATTGADDELVFLALGGLGEIGMNVYLYGIGPPRRRQWLMVDLGITFPGDGDPGADIVLPDLSFIERYADDLAGIVITHAHEDHIGAVIDLWPRLKAPVWATPFTAGMLASKLIEFGSRARIPVRTVELGARFEAGPFDIELVTMAHSIPEPSGLLIRTALGSVFHTGDWKIDREPLIGAPTDEARLAGIGEAGLDALVCDSTNVFRDGRSPSEVEVARSLATIIERSRKRVVVTTFASNVARIKAIAEAASAHGRRLVVAGRAMHRVIRVAIDTGYLPKDFSYLDQEHFSHLPPHETVLIATGSQGEPRAALARIAEAEHPAIELAQGDLVIFSSRTIPGNERAVGRVMNNLARLGCDLVTDGDALVHVTGHPRREELKQIYGWLKPRLAIPMHGEVRHLREHARLARSLGVPEVKPVINGEILRIAPGKVVILDEVKTGRLFRDGRLIVDDAEGPVRERRKLSAVGVAVVALAIGRKGEVLAEPEAEFDGIPLATASGDSMLDVVLDAVEGTLKSIPQAKRRDRDLVADAVRRAVRSAVDIEWGKKPIVKVLISEIGR